MTRPLTGFDRYLIFSTLITAVGAFIVMAFPWLVFIGLFMLVIPGLIMMLLPLAALYFGLFSISWFVFRGLNVHPVLAGLGSAAFCAAIGFGAPAANIAATKYALSQVMADDKIPASPLKIGGTVAIAREGLRDRESVNCDDLCLRLLYNGAASKVLMINEGKPVGLWSIERRKKCPVTNFSTDNDSWHNWPREDPVYNANNWTPGPTLFERVNARIAGGECLISQSPHTSSIDWQIVRTKIVDESDSNTPAFSRAVLPPTGERIAIFKRQSSGELQEVARATNASARPLKRFLMPEYVDPGSGSFAWGRSHIGGDTRWDWDSVKTLQLLIAFKPNLPVGMSAETMRTSLAAALADPDRKRDDSGLLLANALAAEIARNKARSGDANLLAQAIKDPRFVKIDYPHALFAKLGGDLELLSLAAIDRMNKIPVSPPQDGTDWRDMARGDLDHIIAAMPDEWYAAPPPELAALLRDPMRARWLEETIRKLSVGGKSAIPLLLDIVDRSANAFAMPEANGDGYQIRQAHKDKGLYDATDGVSAAVSALCAIGSDARIALPTLDRAYAKLRGNGPQGDAYITTQVFFGRAIEHFPQPEHPSSTIDGSWQKKILMDVGRGECGF